jgi:hypothetical protein
MIRGRKILAVDVETVEGLMLQDTMGQSMGSLGFFC